MENITPEHDLYDAIIAKWEADRRPRRVLFNGMEYSAVKDNENVKFVPVAPVQGFAGGYASNTFTEGAVTSPQAPQKPRKSSPKAKVTSDEQMEGTVSD